MRKKLTLKDLYDTNKEFIPVQIFVFEKISSIFLYVGFIAALFLSFLYFGLTNGSIASLFEFNKSIFGLICGIGLSLVIYSVFIDCLACIWINRRLHASKSKFFYEVKVAGTIGFAGGVNYFRSDDDYSSCQWANYFLAAFYLAVGSLFLGLPIIGLL